MTLKRCKACGRRRLLKFFYKNTQKDRPNAAKYRPECKDCTQLRRTDPMTLARRFGISIHEARDLLRRRP